MKIRIISLSAIISIAIIACMPVSSGAVRAYRPNDTFLGVDMDIAFPLGNFSDVANAGFGINGNFEYPVNPSWNLLLNIGYIHWGGKSNVTGFDYSYSAVPFQGGAKYYFETASADAPRFYLGGLIGFHDMSLSNPVFIDDRFHFIGTGSETEFSLAPLGGLEYGLSNNVLLDVSARYQYVANDFSYFGLRAGLKFRLR